eukprot:2262668-Pyramimonas_sp.AAC.1
MRGGRPASTDIKASSDARSLQPKSVERSQLSVSDDEVQAIAGGWKRLQDSTHGLVTAEDGAQHAAGRLAYDGEVQGFIAAEYVGHNRSARLDSSVQQERRAVQRACTRDDITHLLEDFDENINYAMQLANKDSNRRWKEWCDGACAGGAGKFRRLTWVRDVPTPTTVNKCEHGVAGHPHYIAKAMEEKHAALRRATTAAPE